MIRALILAAGESKRMGKAKLLLPYKQCTIIETVVYAALSSSVDEVYVVLGANAEMIRKKIEHLNVNMIVNNTYTNGMFSSIQCGFSKLPTDTTATVLMLGDQPGIPAFIIDNLIASWRETGKKIVLPRYGARKGHPILVDMRLREELLRSHLENGMRSFMMDNSTNILEIPVNSSAILDDIDTPQDYNEQVINS